MGMGVSKGCGGIAVGGLGVWVSIGWWTDDVGAREM